MPPLRIHWCSPLDSGQQKASEKYNTGRLDFAGIVDFAQEADELGIDSLLMGISYHMPDPLPMIGALVRETRNVKFILAYRPALLHPTLFTQVVNTISWMSDKRISLNLVAGISPDEQAFYGAVLAQATGCERLIVKTIAEARQIPSLRDNLQALEIASESAAIASPPLEPDSQTYFEEILLEAQQLVGAVLSLNGNLGTALLQAFSRGLLDIPYCLHPDNLGRTRTVIDVHGALRWASTGNLPLNPPAEHSRPNTQVRADELFQMLHYMANRYDQSLH